MITNGLTDWQYYFLKLSTTGRSLKILTVWTQELLKLTKLWVKVDMENNPHYEHKIWLPSPKVGQSFYSSPYCWIELIKIIYLSLYNVVSFKIVSFWWGLDNKH